MRFAVKSRRAYGTHTERGIVAFVRKGNGVETTYFEEYNKKVLQPLADSLRERQSIPPQAIYGRVVLSTDGGMTQLQANLSEKSILERKRRIEFYIKTAKNSSSVFQACDTGDG